MKSFHLRWIPNHLTEQLRAHRIQKCQELLPFLEKMEVNKFRTILTGDKSWFMLEYQHAVKWSFSREDGSKRMRQQIGTKKIILTIIWGADGFLVVDLMTWQCSFNSEYFVSYVLAPIIAKVFLRGRIPHTRRLQLHLDNCRVHFSKASEQFMTENHIGRVPHPPYSPDRALLDFWLFGHVKISLAGQTFDEPEQLLEAIIEFLNEIQPPEVVTVFSQWVQRVRWVFENNGDYYHE
jgi:transposase